MPSWVPFTKEMPQPSVMMSKVKEVFNDNEDAANTWMEERRMYLMLTNVKGSVKSEVSGVKCWILFSIAFLTYGPDNSLPPACGMHVARWLCLFRNAGTAANYVSYIRYACRFKDLSMAWDDATVRLTLKGLKKDHMMDFRICFSKLTLIYPVEIYPTGRKV